jgi:hypothetical protein
MCRNHILHIFKKIAKIHPKKEEEKTLPINEPSGLGCQRNNDYQILLEIKISLISLIILIKMVHW